ncbi:MAG: heme-binding domain-containing protein [Verrucomicrobia bacterium]|nr:heme-binding domain-containing protein [Verrucomicrobiota bacterium]
MKRLKWILPGLAVAFVAIQGVRPAKNIAIARAGQDITDRYPAPPEVKRLLVAACYDCHSDTTRYPWYAEVQPVGWWLSSHVNDGKNHLNFSAFAGYPARRAAAKLDAIIDQVTDREMPLTSYRLGHPEARLTDAQIKLLSDWAEAVRQRILADNNLAD